MSKANEALRLNMPGEEGPRMFFGFFAVAKSIISVDGVAEGIVKGGGGDALQVIDVTSFRMVSGETGVSPVNGSNAKLDESCGLSCDGSCAWQTGSCCDN